MIVYAIRDKTTGLYITEPTSRQKNTKTWLEADSEIPRIWTSRQKVKSFLILWLKGKLIRKYRQYTGDPYRGIYYHDSEPVESRKKENMEIVIFRLEELPQIKEIQN